MNFTTRDDLISVLGARAADGGAPGWPPFVRVSSSPGAAGPPLRWLDTAADLALRSHLWRQALESAGITSADRVLHALPPQSATARDCWAATLELNMVSIGLEGAQLDHLQAYAPTVLVATPTDALHLARTAAEHEPELAGAPLRLVVLTGEPGGSITSTRSRIQNRLGVRTMDVYALTEAGVIGWSCAARPGDLHLDEDAFGVEAIAPDSDAPVPDGQLGELAITSRAARGIPLERYRTADLVRLSREPCACGRGVARAEGGVLGRTTDRLVVRGIELLPSMLDEVIRRHPAVGEFRLNVYDVRGACELGVEIEVDGAIASEGDRSRVAAEVSDFLRRSLGLRLHCDVVAPGSLIDQDSGRRARRLRRQ